jgi:hypothetical protein
MINFIEKHTLLFLFIFGFTLLMLYVITSMICNAISKDKQNKSIKYKESFFLIIIKKPKQFMYIAFTFLIVLMGATIVFSVIWDMFVNKSANIDKHITHFLAVLSIKIGGDKLLNNKKNEEEN